MATAGCQRVEAVEDPVAYDGRNLYLRYCASCHGADGGGDGPVASALAAPLEDLRTLRVRHGTFPHGWLKEVIDGRNLPAAHGTPDMPVWGWQFRLMEDSDAHAEARIEALVDYLERIQRDP